MNLNELFSVSSAKISDLKARLERLKIDLRHIEESFVRGGGKGGQKINKTANAVVLRYAPLGLTVKVQRDRQRNVNRFLALRELVDQVEMKISPATSERMKQWDKLRKRKDRGRRRSSATAEGPSPQTDSRNPSEPRL